jgi:hypothetical protein
VRGIASVHTWHFFVHESGWKQAPAVDAILRALHGALYRGK